MNISVYTSSHSSSQYSSNLNLIWFLKEPSSFSLGGIPCIYYLLPSLHMAGSTYPQSSALIPLPQRGLSLTPQSLYLPILLCYNSLYIFFTTPITVYNIFICVALCIMSIFLIKLEVPWSMNMLCSFYSQLSPKPRIVLST